MSQVSSVRSLARQGAPWEPLQAPFPSLAGC
jgi:hypothetical protein